MLSWNTTISLCPVLTKEQHGICEMNACYPRNKITFKLPHLNIRVTSSKRFCCTSKTRNVVNFFSCFLNVWYTNCIENTVINFMVFDTTYLYKTFIIHRINVCTFYYIIRRNVNVFFMITFLKILLRFTGFCYKVI